MSVFAKRLKNGRSWSNLGLDKFIDIFVALQDNLEIKTLQGILEQTEEVEETSNQAKPPKHFVEKLKDSAAEATRNNLGYLKQDIDRKSTRLNSSHVAISYAVFCLKKKNIIKQ